MARKRQRWREFGGLSKAGRPSRVVERQVQPTAAWFLTIAGRENVCDECASPIAKGEEFGYHHEPRGVLCQICVDRTGVVVRVSKRLEAARQQTKLVI